MKKSRTVVFIVAGILLSLVFLAGCTSSPQQNSTIILSSTGTIQTPSTTNAPVLIPSTQSDQMSGGLSQNIILEKPLPAKVERVLVYKTISPIVNNETTLALAKKFNVTGNMVGDQGVQSKDLRFSIWSSKKSGSVQYSDSKRPNAQMDAPEKLPTDEEGVLIATQFLEDRDLFPEGAAFTKTYRENAIAVSEKPNRVVFGQIGVWFNRTLNGMNVEGTQMVVYVGGDGDVIGYFANWRNYQPYEDLPVKSPEKAFEELKNKGFMVGIDAAENVSITDVYLTYRTKAVAKTEYYLEPVWVFKGNALVHGNTIEAAKVFIPALTEVPTELIIS